MMNQVYEHPYPLLADVRVDQSVAPGTDLTLSGVAKWLACTDKICVPEKAGHAVAMKAGNGQLHPASSQSLHASSPRIPLPLNCTGQCASEGTKTRYSVTLAAS